MGSDETSLRQNSDSDPSNSTAVCVVFQALVLHDELLKKKNSVLERHKFILLRIILKHNNYSKK